MLEHALEDALEEDALAATEKAEAALAEVEGASQTAKAAEEAVMKERARDDDAEKKAEAAARQQQQLKRGGGGGGGGGRVAKVFAAVRHGIFALAVKHGIVALAVRAPRSVTHHVI